MSPILIGTAFAMIGLVTFIVLARASRAASYWKVTLAALLILLGVNAVGYGVKVLGTQSTNAMYKAASRQGLSITVDTWTLTPVATKPCRVELSFDTHKKRLVLIGTETAATPEVLKVLCAR